jgi:hypothetical protein
MGTSGSDVPNLNPNLMAKGPSWLLTMIAIGALIMSLNLDQMLTRQSISTVILRAQLPAACTSSKPLFPWPVFRSSVPVPSQPYCGVIITEHGTFRVIEDGMFIPGAMRRSEIVNAFKPDCEATLHYFGWGGPPKRWPGYDPKSKLWVYAVEYPIECSAPPLWRLRINSRSHLHEFAASQPTRTKCLPPPRRERSGG